jgi:hypothetical protein
VLSVETALTCRRILVAAAGSYAFASLLSRSLDELRILDSDVSDSTRRLVLLAVALATAIATYVVTLLGRRRRMSGS